MIRSGGEVPSGPTGATCEPRDQRGSLPLVLVGRAQER